MLLYFFIITFFSIILSNDYYQNVIRTAKIFGVGEKYLKDSIYQETSRLILIGSDIYGRNQFLNSKAADAFYNMKEAALKDSINLSFISAFRSFEYQKKLLIKN